MTFKNESVLNFYKELPFNIYGDINAATEQIKKFNPLEIYPELNDIIKEYKRPIIKTAMRKATKTFIFALVRERILFGKRLFNIVFILPNY